MLDLRESSTYQAIIAEGEARGRVEGRVEGEAQGRADGERDILLLLGSQRLGEPTAAEQAILADITSPQHLTLLASRLLSVASWHELLND